MKSVTVLLTLLALLGASAVYDHQLTAAEKVVICHVPPGNPAAAQTLTVGAPAAEAHLDKHSQDSLGQCESICKDLTPFNICELDKCQFTSCSEDGTIRYFCFVGSEAESCGEVLACLEGSEIHPAEFSCVGNLPR